MSKIAILTDSSCDIPQELADKYGIDIMSFTITLDDVTYLERVDCTTREFYGMMRTAVSKSTILSASMSISGASEPIQVEPAVESMAKMH